MVLRLKRFIFDSFSGIDVFNAVDVLKPLFIWLWNSLLVPIAAWTGGVIVKVFTDLNIALKNFSDWIKNNEGFVKGMTTTVLLFFAAWTIVELLAGLGMLMGVKGFGGLITQLIDLSAKMVIGIADTVRLKLMYAGDVLAAIGGFTKKCGDSPLHFCKRNY